MNFGSSREGGGGGSFSENKATGRTPFSSTSSYSPSPLEPRNEELLPRVSTAEEIAAIEKEHMFDKVVTPSDVGKLNRLVIPKQHAEKYFPLDSSTNEKGLFLNFEDRTGKPWRFRYSYWNSSQSYVMTKGWSRFVKEKKLDAGDVVSFQRGLGESRKDRLYIDWRRRPDPPNQNHHHHHHHAMNYSHYGYGVPPTPNHYSFHQRSVPWSPLLMQPPGSSSSLAAAPEHHYSMNVHPYRSNNGYINSGDGYGYGNVVNVNPVYYMRPGGGGGGFPLHEQEGIANSLHRQVGPGHPMIRVEPAMVLESVPVVHGKVAVATGKRLRLFGVNMDCAEVSDDQSEDCVEILSSSTTATSATTTTILSQSQSQSQSQLELRLYDVGTAAATTDIFNRGKTSSSPSTSMSLDFDLSEQ